MNKVEIDNGTLWVGDSSEVLKQYPDNHFDSVITDAPYGIEFLGKDWDNNTGAIEVWSECLRVLKPGGYLLSFGAPRTYHRLATNLEDIGFEIKDSLMWLYGSGFPKAQDVGKQIEKKQGKRKTTKGIGSSTFDAGEEKRYSLDCGKCGKRAKNVKNQYTQCVNGDNECPLEESQRQANNEWTGWKTGLKPAHEPIVMCRKPLDNKMGKRGVMKSKISVLENVKKWGVGALNIDATRITTDENDSYNKIEAGIVEGKKHGIFNEAGKEDLYAHKMMVKNDIGRFPSNVIGEVEGYQKYFYHPKVNRKERHIGLDMENAPRPGNTNERKDDVAWMVGNPDAVGSSEFVPRVDANTHPTIKPVALMLYLVKMITPPNGKVLDCFNGSGSTGMAVKEFGGEYVGIDLDENYIEISRKRILAWNNNES